MPSSDGVDDVFFDATDCLLSEESAVEKKELGCQKLDYEIWMNEPQSVKERRKTFLCNTGLVEFTPKNEKITLDKSLQTAELDRFKECSGTVLRSLVLSMNREEENVVCCEREMNCEANTMVEELGQDQMSGQNVALEGESTGLSQSVHQCENQLEECKDVNRKKAKKWWKHIVRMKKRREDTCISEETKPSSGKPKTNRIKVKQNKKSCMEVSALYMGQEIQAHKGYISTMKFSPDGQYLASGGEDKVVRIWRVTSVDASIKSFTDEGDFGNNVKEDRTTIGKKSVHVPVVIPDKLFQIEDTPLQEFHGHAADVLDIAWSNSNYLLSCSVDETVRLWQVGCDQCLNVFHHSNYVTCIQFNPVDENYFISGSIDGKVRIWGLCEERVVDWADVWDAISVVCYHPDGKGFIVGTITGTCRFYESSANGLQLEAEVHFQDRKKASGNGITGIQFSLEDSQRIMITSEDSKLRILDGVDVIHKFKGLPKSGSQLSASFSTTGKHIISVGGDCRVYVWNYDDSCFPTLKHKRSIRSCEHFFCEDVSVAAQWPGKASEPNGVCSDSNGSSSSSLQDLSQRRDNLETGSWIRDSEPFSLGSWFSIDGPCRGSATWPEEKLPLWDVTLAEYECDRAHHQPHHHQQQKQLQKSFKNVYDPTSMTKTWGLVFVTAGYDGMIKIFYNYGLPVRLK